ncbi:hydroxymethylpyrimidine/phosphomethylpyrimidine kinase [bacterium]|nr:hydroxymethylpyrimidine/phosphomethylpyrimidine kinase [bacterium]
MINKKYFMTIAASDNSGGAGIQQDLKVADKLGFWGLSVLTAITVQDFSGLDSIYPLPLNLIKDQFIKNITSFPVSVIKIGALCSGEITELITNLLEEYYSGIVVIDPVLAPTKGKAFFDEKEIDIYKNLIKKATILTPNKRELEVLASGKADSYPQALTLAHALLNETNCNIYIKGGHFSSPDSQEINEYLVTQDNQLLFTKTKQIFTYSHGTGCYFASALACYLILYNNLVKACQKATEDVSSFYSELNKIR